MDSTFDQRAAFREIVLTAALPANSQDLDVEQRFPKLIGLAQPAGPVLARCKAVVVGVGSVGRRVALHLARAGVAVLWLVDPGRFDEHANLITQEILPADLNTAKATNTGQACKAISPGTQVLVHEGKIQELDPVTMADADVVFLATDHLAVEVDVSSRFRALGIPLVQASVHGETLVAQVRFLANRQADAPCLVCSFGSDEWRHLNRSSIFSCGGTAGRGRPPNENIRVMPTVSTSFLCSLAADLAMTQWTRHLLGLGRPVADSILQHCGYTHHVTQSELHPHENCPCDHTVLERVRARARCGECSLRELAAPVGGNGDSLDATSFTLGALSYVQAAVCRCDAYPVARFMAACDAVSVCSRCGEPVVPQPFYTHRPAPGALFGAQANRPLRELGARDAAWAVVRRGDRGALICEEANKS